MLEPNELFLDHFDRPRGAGAFAPDEPGVFRGEGGSEHHGALVRIELKCDDGTVREARFTAWGCSATLACASLAAEWLRGRALADAAAADVKTLAAPLDLPPERLYAPLVVEDAVRAAAAAMVK